jgi:hypothetical protein
MKLARLRVDDRPAAVLRFADMAPRCYVLPVFSYIVEQDSPAGSSFA